MSGCFESVVDRILERLRSELAVVDPDAHARVHDELRQLVGTMSTIKSAFIRKEESMSTNLSYISGIDMDLEGKIHDLEDDVDELFSESSQQRKQLVKVCNILCSSFKKKHALIFPKTLEPRVYYVNSQISCIEKTCMLSSSEKSEIMKIFFWEENDCNVSVIPIISKFGNVKTALARFIFYEERVQQEFGSRTWVRVYELFGRRRVRVKIDPSTFTDDYYSEESFSTNKVEDLLKEQTAGKRFLAILEDLRSVEDEKYWRCLKELSSGSKWGSKVIIITSDDEAAEKMGTKPPFHLGSSSDQLNEDEFIGEFRKETGIPEHVVSEWLNSALSKYDDDRASRVTVINTRLDMLQFYWTYHFWAWMYEGPRGEIATNGSLFQRYVELPLPLKQCFEYCRLFPEDYEIDVRTLIHLWMAQVFIQLLGDLSQCPEDVGYTYFEDLLKRGFFKQVHHDPSDHILNSSVTRCKIDCSVLNLLIILCGVRCFLLNPYNMDYNIEYRVTRQVSFDFHLHSPRQILIWMELVPKMIRSILLPRQSLSKDEQRMIDPEKILYMTAQYKEGFVHWRPGLVRDVIISAFLRLRALDLHDLGIKVVPYDIGKLMHLRYLDLSKNAYIKALPASITKLEYLQSQPHPLHWT